MDLRFRARKIRRKESRYGDISHAKAGRRLEDEEASAKGSILPRICEESTKIGVGSVEGGCPTEQVEKEDDRGRKKRKKRAGAALKENPESSSVVSSLFESEAIALAIKHLKASDAKLRALIETCELPKFQKCTSSFSSLARSIVYQQLATKAAAAIHTRLVTLCGGDASITPTTILSLPASELRSIGISFRKASYLHDLAKKFIEEGLSDAAIFLMEDARLMSVLTSVKGIGPWSVHMFMIFALHRPDVLPVGDLGVRKGFQKLYALKSPPTVIEMEQLAACWRPYRSLGAWYMWRLIGTKAPVAASEELVSSENGP